jgi:hypothetical protein
MRKLRCEKVKDWRLERETKKKEKVTVTNETEY